MIAEEVLKDRNWQPDPEPIKAFRNLSFSIVNASQSSDKYSLHYDGAGTKMFSGKFWSDPIDTVKPEKSVNFQTCTSSFMAGCTGGISWKVQRKDGSPAGFLVLTFSNPAVGKVKASVTHLLKYKISEEDLKDQYENMHDVDTKQYTRCTLYRKKDTHFIIVYKDTDQKW